MKSIVPRTFQAILAISMQVMAGNASSAQFQTREAALAALKEYNLLIIAEPNFAVLYTLRGDAYYALNDFDGATENYTRAIKLDAKQDKAYFGRGMALGRVGRVDEAIADLSVFIQRHPESSVAYTKRGVRNIWRNNLGRLSVTLLVPSSWTRPTPRRTTIWAWYTPRTVVSSRQPSIFRLQYVSIPATRRRITTWRSVIT